MINEYGDSPFYVMFVKSKKFGASEKLVYVPYNNFIRTKPDTTVIRILKYDPYHKYKCSDFWFEWVQYEGYVPTNLYPSAIEVFEAMITS